MRLLQASTVLAFLLVPVAAGASTGIFVQVPDIPGDATAAGFAAQIEAKSVTISAALAAGKPTLAPVIVSKAVDGASPKLFDALGKGKVFPTLTITATGQIAGGPQIARSRYLLKDVRVADFRVVDTAGASAPVEQVSFAAGSVTMEYIPVDGAGRAGTPVSGSIP